MNKIKIKNIIFGSLIAVFGFLFIVSFVKTISILNNNNDLNSSLTTDSLDIQQPHVHVEVIDEIVEPTCNLGGKTQGSHCLECNEVLIAQKDIPKLEHDYSISWKWEGFSATAVFVCENDNNHMGIIPALIERNIIQIDETKEVLRNVAVVNYLNETYTDTKEEEYISTVGLEYKLNDDLNSYSVIGKGTCLSSDIYIPYIYNNLPVTSIDEKAFYRNNDLKRIVIPDSVQIIEKQSFRGCSSLRNLKIGDGVLKIGKSAFDLCENLTNLIIGNSVNEIEDFAFNNCSKIMSVVIPSSVTIMGENAFDLSYKSKIYCEATSKPDGWNKYWAYGTVYWYNEKRPYIVGNFWHYVDGEVTIWIV